MTRETDIARTLEALELAHRLAHARNKGDRYTARCSHGDHALIEGVIDTLRLLADTPSVEPHTHEFRTEERFLIDRYYEVRACKCGQVEPVSGPSVEPAEEGTVDADGTYHPTAEDHAMGNTAAGHEHWDDR